MSLIDNHRYEQALLRLTDLAMNDSYQQRYMAMTRPEAYAMAQRHLQRHEKYGTLHARIAVVLGESAGCSNCGCAVATGAGLRHDRCEKCQVLGSDFD